MSDLRDQIAAVIHADLNPPCCDECCDFGPDDWVYELADKLIAALGLHITTVGDYSVGIAGRYSAALVQAKTAKLRDDQIVCTHRWDTGDNTDPGYCQCIRWANHDGAHHCCCGQVDGDE